MSLACFFVRARTQYPAFNSFRVAVHIFKQKETSVEICQSCQFRMTKVSSLLEFGRVFKRLGAQWHSSARYWIWVRNGLENALKLGETNTRIKTSPNPSSVVHDNFAMDIECAA